MTKMVIGTVLFLSGLGLIVYIVDRVSEVIAHAIRDSADDVDWME